MPLKALALVALCACLAQAAEKPRANRKPAPPSVEREAFDQSLELIRVQAAKSYLARQDMPDTRLLEPLLENLTQAEAAAARKRLRALNDLLEEVRYVQKGRRSEDDLATYKEMVDLMADSLGAGAYVGAEAGRDRGNAGELAACRDRVAGPSGDKKAAAVTCVGRLQAEKVYVDEARPPIGPAGQEGADENSVRALLLAAMAERHSRISDQVPQRISSRLNETRRQLLSQIVRELPAPGGGVIPIYQVQTQPALVPAVATDQPAGTGAQTDARRAAMTMTDFSLMPPTLENVDFKKGADLAGVAVDNEVGFKGRCYAYVKKALAAMGIMDSDEGGGSAYMFNKFFKEHHLENRKLRRVKEPRWPLPIGSIVVWGPGCCGYNAKHGHIEILVSINPPRACSDGCGGFQTGCLESLTAETKKAAAEYQRLSAQRGQLSGKALAQLERKLKALQKKVDNPRVNVYNLERQPLTRPTSSYTSAYSP